MRTKFIINVLLAAALAVLTAISTDAARIVDYPLVNFSNTHTIDVVKVEFNDSNTVLHVEAHYHPKYWIKIAKVTHLEADGKQYALIGAEGIEPGERFWMSENGEGSFKLIFEKMPESTESFDLSEGNGPNAWHLWNIDLTGKKPDKYPVGLPEELQETPDSQSVPMPEFSMGTTTINLHLLPYHDGFPKSMTMYVKTLAGRQNEYKCNFDENGNASISFEQYGPANVTIVDPNTSILHANITPYPGETIDCYADMRVSGRAAMYHRPEDARPSYRSSYSTGKYASYDKMLADRNSYFGLNMYTGTFADYRMTGDEYKAMVKSKYYAMLDTIATKDIPEMEKEYGRIQLQNDILEAMANYNYLLKHNYMHEKQDWKSPVPEDSIIGKLSDADFAEVATWFNINNPRLLMEGSAIADFDWSTYIPEATLSKETGTFKSMASKANNRELTQSDRDSLMALSNPFFAIACDSIQSRADRKFAELSKLVEVTPVPDVPVNEIFDSIVAPHKGKVVVVDLWNTWCGPCRAAHSIIEPLKRTTFANDDIVWIYLADESSDINLYLTMLQDIKGIHYRLKQNQINEIQKRFNVDGIPYYIIVDREGNAEGRPDIRDPNKYVKAIKEKL